MRLEDIIKQIDNVSKKEIRTKAPKDSREIKEIIRTSNPTNIYEKMVLGYLTSICAENMYPETFHIELDNLDYIGFELENGNIDVKKAGNMLGSCMKGGKITAGIAGDETGASMMGGELIADEIKSIGNTIGGRIITKKAEKLSRTQGAEILINGVKYKRGLLDRLFR